ncbi:cytoskeleton protein RodZ [Nitrosomonas sp. Nm51]|uniref:helix-turn-helix domain-containing protein n=1 Tax=Nitrosomonas sp. Nm51 TaxID=133720 RepID=UPI0008BD5C94|nr:helix-turn-helix domain-containing protein [Nitrosomonas sp. Nm51]SER12507.1 cytoskeleton protein RodZ [Nitrosomonas sp. Nm51]
MDERDNEKEKKDERMHLNDAIMKNLHADDVRAHSASEADKYAQDTFQNSPAIGRDTGVTDNMQTNALSVESESEISHFLKTESHSDTPDNQVLNSASVVHGVGHMLRNARVSRNMSMEDVSRQLRISVQQVEAIEKESFDVLPGRTFVRGFVRNYANLMQLDSDAIVQLLPGPTTTVSHIEHTPFKIQEMKSSSRSGRGINNTVLTIVILALLAAVLFFLHDKLLFWRSAVQSTDLAVQQENGQASVELQLPLSSLKLSDKPDKTTQFNQDSLTGLNNASAINTFGTLTLNFTAEAHVKVTDGNDDIIFEQNNASGTQQRVSGRKPLSIVISDASAVEVTYNDRLIDIKPYTNTQNGSAQLMLE